MSGSSAAEAAPVEVVIVAYRSRALLLECLGSLEADRAAGRIGRVHVVDNASGDGTAAAVRAAFPGVELVELERNAGFAHANNLVLRRLASPFVLLLNPDTELRPGVLDHLLAQLEREPRTGMIGCRLVRRDGSFDHAAKRSYPTPTAALAHFTGLGRRAGASDRLAQYRAPHVDEFGQGEVEAINGAFMLVRREAIEQVGLLDERYWLYMEDLDWCRRFRLAGWGVAYDGRVTALHVKGASSGARRGFRQEVAFHAGMWRFYRKFDAGRNPALDVVVAIAVVAKLALVLALGAWARIAGRGAAAAA